MGSDMRPDIYMAYKTGLPENAEAHYHHSHELCFFRHSAVRAFLQGRWQDVGDGDILWIPARIMHRFDYPQGTRYTRLLVNVGGGYLREMLGDMGCEDLLAAAGLDVCRHIHPEPAQFRRLLTLGEEALGAYDMWQRKKDSAEEAHLRARLFCLFYALRSVLDQGQEAGAADVSDCVAQAVAWIDGHYGENVTLDDLAERCHVDKYHLCHQFGRHTGISVMRYVQYRRVIEAEKLLTYTELPLDVVAAQTGFRTMQHFHRVFRELTDATPGKVRSRGKALEDRQEIREKRE